MSNNGHVSLPNLYSLAITPKQYEADQTQSPSVDLHLSMQPEGILRGIRSQNSFKLYETTANFNRMSSHVVGSVNSGAKDSSHVRTSPTNLVVDEKTPGKQGMMEGDFTKSLRQDDDNSARELNSISRGNFKLTPQGPQDPRNAAADSKGNSKESRNVISSHSLS